MATLDLTQMYEDIEGLKGSDGFTLVQAASAKVADDLAEADAEYKLSINLNKTGTETGTVITPGVSNEIGISGVLQPSNGGTGLTTVSSFAELVDEIVETAGLQTVSTADTSVDADAISFSRIILSTKAAPDTSTPGTIWIQMLS